MPRARINSLPPSMGCAASSRLIAKRTEPRPEGEDDVKIKDGVAIVTGSATGIGAETAKLLARKGCRVVVNYSRSREEAEATAAECRKAGVDVLVHQADIADDA